MKTLTIILLFLFIPLLATSQCYPNLKARGQSFYAQQQYDEAIRHYLGALNCPDRPSPQQDAVPDLIKAALQARVDQLNAALDQVEAERQKTEEALAQANKLIDAFYFYADRFALAFKDNQFYYIDKNGDPVEKLGRWESAEQFTVTGLSRVKQSDKLLLLDTFGHTYPLATEMDQLRTGITALDLSEKGLDSIPKAVWDNPQLKILLLFRNKLSSLPPEIGQLQQLSTLDLGFNQLGSLPTEIGQLKQLTRLYLNRNDLKSLPTEIGQLQQLSILDLSDNHLESLPAEFWQLNQLQSLDLNRNQVGNLPVEIRQLQKLTFLGLSYNNITSLTPAIGQLQQLHSLDLSYNELMRLPSTIGQLNKLDFLNLNTNQLTNLPPAIEQLQQLRTLDLSRNDLGSLSPEIGYLNQLRKLNLNRNKLISLPSEIGQLQLLQSLDLSRNQLKSIPPEIAQLQQLYFLNLNANQLQKLPPEITQLQLLRSLDLNRNYLSSLPATFPDMINLQFLDLKETAFSLNKVHQLEQQLPWCVVYFRPISAEKYFDRQEYEKAFSVQQQIANESENLMEYWSLSWYALFAEKYKEAIQAAQRSLTINPEKVGIETNLALGYVLNNQWEEAESIYQKWKGKSLPDDDRLCDEVFLQDIAALEAAGITHPDFEKVRQLLAEDD